ncbi:MAG TPA: 50S ribosomal protein L11 methyltransferase [Methylophilaceae bacterium]|nr:50S ribosomal protein L11 methyltransferase [Methylophilaceae bacterium]
MAWLSLNIEAAEHIADLLSDALLDLGAISVSIEDAHLDTPLEQAIFGEPGDPPPGIWQQNRVNALYPEDTAVLDILQQLGERMGLQGFSYSTEIIAEQDWVRATQSQFEPIQIGEKMWIVPSWHDAPDPDALNIQLDPGLAFGTGSHPTTHLCLAWLQQQVKPLSIVLDYGCGSGILAIAAKKLGAAQVTGTDIDPQAIEASRFNASRNQADIDFYLPDRLPSVQVDIVVANILSSALTVLAPALASTCKSGGSIALSGILEPQATQVSEVYAEWFDMGVSTKMDGWVLLTGRKR